MYTSKETKFDLSLTISQNKLRMKKRKRKIEERLKKKKELLIAAVDTTEPVSLRRPAQEQSSFLFFFLKITFPETQNLSEISLSDPTTGLYRS